MSNVEDELGQAFEDAGHDVGELAVNRQTVRVGVKADDASASALQDIVYSVLDEDEVLGLDVTTESVEGSEDVMTVVSFRYRG